MFNFKNLIAGLKNINYIFISLYDSLRNFFFSIKLVFKYHKINKKLRILNCKKGYIRESYIYLGYTHLEVCPYYGIFIQGTHRLFDLYPRITFLDDDEAQENYIDTIFNGVICVVDFYKTPIDSNLLNNIDTKFHSISLNFVLDRIKKADLDIFILNIKNKLLPGGTVFGVTVTKNRPHKNKALDFINEQNKKNFWFNKETTTADLEAIFEKYFDNIIIEEIGSCVLFILSSNKPKPDFTPIIENMWQEGKYIELK